MNQSKTIEKTYEAASRRYAQLGVDTEAAMKKLAEIWLKNMLNEGKEGLLVR